MVALAKLRLIDSLSETAGALKDALDADACAISRVLGDVLVLVTGCSPADRSLLSGQGYLISEFPETREVIATRRPRAICVTDAPTCEAEVTVMRDLGYAALLMLPLVLSGEAWGLVEVYRAEPRPFGAAEIRAASAVLAALG